MHPQVHKSYYKRLTIPLDAGSSDGGGAATLVRVRPQQLLLAAA